MTDTDQKMADVSHTAPDGFSVSVVWNRGGTERVNATEEAQSDD